MNKKDRSIVRHTRSTWKTPDGTVNVFILESTPIQIILSIGKAGTSIAAWAYALQEMVNLALDNHTIEEVTDILTDITTHTSTFNVSQGVQCRSTAEAVAFSLKEYIQYTKRKEAKR